MAGELLHAIAQIEQAEVAGADDAAAGADEELAAALEHIDAHVVDEGTGHLPGAAHADVVAGVGAPTATAVGGQQVIPAVAIDHDRRFAIDRDVHGLVVRVDAFTGLGVELDQPDVAEIGTVDQPQLPVGGIQKEPRIDGIAELDPIGRGDDSAFLPFVVGGIRVEGLARYHVDGGPGLPPMFAATYR